MDYSNSSFHELNISFCEIDVDEIISLDMNDNSLDFGNLSFIENVDPRETFISTPPRRKMKVWFVSSFLGTPSLLILTEYVVIIMTYKKKISTLAIF